MAVTTVMVIQESSSKTGAEEASEQGVHNQGQLQQTIEEKKKKNKNLQGLDPVHVEFCRLSIT